MSLSTSNTRNGYLTSFGGIFPSNSGSQVLDLQFEVEVDGEEDAVHTDSPTTAGVVASRRVRSYLASNAHSPGVMEPLISSPTLRFRQQTNLLKQSDVNQSSQNQSMELYFHQLPGAESKRRRRHFSVEDSQADYEDLYMDESSTNSHDSSGYFHQGHDMDPLKPFLNDLSFAEEALTLLPEHNSRSVLFGNPGQIQTESMRKEQEELASQLISAVRGGKRPGLQFPQGMVDLIAGHVLQEAEGEPYGLKGCVIHIQYEGQTALHQVASLRCDPGTLSTFELTLTLRQGQQPTWSQRLARRFSFSNLSSPASEASSAELGSPANGEGYLSTVSTSYKLVKKRVYRNGEAEDVSPM